MATRTGSTRIAGHESVPHTTTMQAIVQRRYGTPDVLALEEIERPAVGEDDVLIRVHAAGVSYPDGVFISGIPYVVRLIAGLRRPRHPVRGSEVAGTVTEVGAKVADLRPGDAVFGWCGRAADGGGFAEYASAPRRLVVPKPVALTFEQAAALPVSGVTALQAVRDWAAVQPGQTVLINGASGGVGTFAVQIARALGASETLPPGALGCLSVDALLALLVRTPRGRRRSGAASPKRTVGQ